MRLLHAWKPDAATFDDENLVSAAGLVPVLALAEQTHLSDLIDEQVRFDAERIISAAANPVGKITSIIAGMLTGADSIADLQIIRSGGSQKLFGAVYAPSTLGMFLREFTHGHTRQLGAVLARHLLAMAARSAVLAGIDMQAFIDIDSLRRPVYGHTKQGASFRHTKIANRQVLRKGVSPLVTTISTMIAAPVIAGVWLRAGKARSGRGAASMVTEAINLAIAAGATAGNMLVRGDSAYGYSDVIAAVLRAGAKFSFVLTKNRAVNRAIGAIAADAWTPVRYPGAVQDPDTREWISDAEVAEISYTMLVKTDRVVEMQLRTQLAATVTGGAIQMLAASPDWEQAYKGFMGEYLPIKEAAEMIMSDGNSECSGADTRHVEMAANLALGLLLWQQIFTHFGLGKEAKEAVMAQDELFSLCKDHLASQRETPPGASVIKALRAVLAASQAHIVSVDGQGAPPVANSENGGLINPMLGWRNGPDCARGGGDPIGYLVMPPKGSSGTDPVILIHSVNGFLAARRHHPELIMHGSQPAATWSSVWTEGFCAPSWTQKKMGSGRAQATIRKMVNGIPVEGVPIRMSVLLALNETGSETTSEPAGE